MDTVASRIDHSQGPLSILVSTVANANATHTTDVTVGAVLERIKSGTYSNQITKIREVYKAAVEAGEDPKAAVRPFKQRLVGVMWSGRFSSRQKPVDSRLVDYSGYLCADLDELGDTIDEVRSALIKSPHVFALFESPTGEGLKALFPVPNDQSKHLESFQAILDHVAKLTGCVIDLACKDPSRLCFVSDDPDLYLNEHATEVDCTHRTHSPHKTHRTQNSHTPHTVVGCVVDGHPSPSRTPVVSVTTVESAIAMSLSHTRRNSHLKLIKLAGCLKAHTLTVGKQFQHSELRLIVDQWFEKSKKNLDPNKTADDCYVEFLDAWGNAQPMMEGAVEQAWRLSADDPRPPELPPDLDGPRIVRFAAFLRRLQLLTGDAPFYLSPYKAKEIIGHPHHSTICIWLGAFRVRGVIRKVEPGITKKLAASYRYNFEKAQ